MHFVVVVVLFSFLLLQLVSVTVGSRSTTKKEPALVAYWLVLRTGGRTVVVLKFRQSCWNVQPSSAPSYLPERYGAQWEGWECYGPRARSAMGPVGKLGRPRPGSAMGPVGRLGPPRSGSTMGPVGRLGPPRAGSVIGPVGKLGHSELGVLWAHRILVAVCRRVGSILPFETVIMIHAAV